MGELVANNGTFILNNTTIATKTIDAIVVLEDTIFEYINIDAENVTADYIAEMPYSIVKAGAIITPINDLQFTEVNLQSGSVALVLG